VVPRGFRAQCAAAEALASSLPPACTCDWEGGAGLAHRPASREYRAGSALNVLRRKAWPPTVNPRLRSQDLGALVSPPGALDPPEPPALTGSESRLACLRECGAGSALNVLRKKY
jgi:hypothetical protein